MVRFALDARVSPRSEADIEIEANRALDRANSDINTFVDIVNFIVRRLTFEVQHPVI